MFIYNIKLSGTKLFKIIFFIMIIFIILLCAIIAFKLFSSNNENSCINNQIPQVTNKNYSSILKSVHENIDSYIGMNFKYSGFVYRVYDLEKNDFVLARNMIISSDMQTVIVGFLCDYSDAILFKDFSWVEIEGKIDKCMYHNSPMPIIKIEKIKQIDKPNDEYVYPPDENYVPTAYMF